MALTETLVKNYVDQGLARSVDDETIRSLDGDATLFFEKIYDEEEESGISIYSNDVHLEDLYFDDENFTVKFNDIMTSELNL